ncbi:hypothetical protein CI1B_09110 [Bradyrhizobium ivorense]|uniref:Uncharacterized protein n=1 Tax=Bradyrhizobium ivorense TaxID=2511166 RepID=A0A508STM6_9BRAD|nr:hypothetical protein [Bradyrhizobium ivorense]VIO65803.1 hypothetical protein CI1B_09110 [Bradyrhizobium ivorense]
MKWMQERDLLIAQTMAFVQSVTGKRPDAEALMAAPSKANPPAPAPQVAVPIAATPKVAADPEAATPSPLPVPTVIEVPPPAPPAAVAVTVGEAPPAPAPLPQFATLDIRGDFGSEVRARVANFRANQQRFIREREEYCSSTMAKVRAAIRDNSELPRSGK